MAISMFKRGLMLLFALCCCTSSWATLYDSDDDGYYEINSVEDFEEFADGLVSSYSTYSTCMYMNVKLTADLGSADSPVTTYIRSYYSSYPYCGVFDGNGKTITVGYSVGISYIGLFQYLGGATIKDLTLEGTITTTGQFAGSFAGQIVKSSSSATNFIRCVSNVTINTTRSGDGTHGGFWGLCFNSVNVEDCAFTGAISGANTHSCSGFGWTTGEPSTKPVYTITNSYVSATFDINSSSSSDDSHPLVRTYEDPDLTVTNCYYLNVPNSTANNGYGTQKTEAEFKSGEVAFLLQADREELVWGQVIGTDDFPVLSSAASSHVVYKGGTYQNVDDLTSLTFSISYEGLDGATLETQPESITYGETVAIGEPTRDGYTFTGWSVNGSSSTVKSLTISAGCSSDLVLKANWKVACNYVGGFCSDCGDYEPAEKVDGVYQIANAGNLLWFAAMANNDDAKADFDAQDASANAILTADIDMAGYDFTPICFNGSPGDPNGMYSGTFDGNYHTISNLTITKESYSNVGLFGQLTDGAVVKNLGLVDCNITGYENVGGIAGAAAGEASIPADADADDYGITIQNCYVIGSLSGYDIVGGIFGRLEKNTSVVSCYTAVTISGYGAAGIASHIGGTEETTETIKNCYSLDNTYFTYSRFSYNLVQSNTGTLPEASFANGEVTYKLNQENDEPVWFQTIGTDAYPTFNTSSKQVYQWWDGYNAIYTNNASESTYSATMTYPTPTVVEDVYQIGTVGELLWFAAMVNGDDTYAVFSEQNVKANAVLTADIDMTGIDFTPIAYHDWNEQDNSTMYGGTFDGQGHVISNLTVNKKYQDNAGLFGNISEATVKNLGLVDCNIAGDDHIGGLVGDMCNSTVSNCYVQGTIAGGDYAGGIAGHAWNGVTIENCYVIGDISTKYSNHGAIVGELGGTPDTEETITNCYYQTEYELCSMNRCYTSDTENNQALNLANFKSGLVAYLLNSNDGIDDDVWFQNIDNDQEVDTYPVLLSSHGTVYSVRYYCGSKYTNDGDADAEGTDEDGHHFNENGVCVCGERYQAATYVEATETEEAYFAISNAGQLMWFSELVNAITTHDPEGLGELLPDLGESNYYPYSDANAVLTNDIDMSGVDNYSIPIGTSYSYGGTFDGQGYRILDINISSLWDEGDYDFGVFDNLDNATIKNLGIVGGTISGKAYVGAFAADAYQTTFSNCYSTVSIKSTWYAAAGFVANAQQCVFDKCYTTSNITGDSEVGGFACYSWGSSYTNCYSTNNISAEEEVGGFVYQSEYSSYSNCYSSCDITTDYLGIGGFISDSDEDVLFENVYFRDGDGYMATKFAYSYNDGVNLDPEQYDGVIIRVSAEEMASGKVAHLLQEAQDEQVWGQVIGVDASPIFSDDVNKKVVEVAFDFEESADDNFATYVNYGNALADYPVYPTTGYSYVFSIDDAEITTDYVYEADAVVTVKTSEWATALTTFTATDKTIIAVYTLAGQKVNELQHGVNVVVFSNGTTEKILIK